MPKRKTKTSKSRHSKKRHHQNPTRKPFWEMDTGDMATLDEIVAEEFPDLPRLWSEWPEEQDRRRRATSPSFQPIESPKGQGWLHFFTGILPNLLGLTLGYVGFSAPNAIQSTSHFETRSFNNLSGISSLNSTFPQKTRKKRSTNKAYDPLIHSENESKTQSSRSKRSQNLSRASSPLPHLSRVKRGGGQSCCQSKIHEEPPDPISVTAFVSQLQSPDIRKEAAAQLQDFLTPATLTTTEQFKRLVSLYTELHHLIYDSSQAISTKIYEIVPLVKQQLESDRFSKAAPKKLHFIWIGKIEQIQVDYIKTWQQFNPDYEINVWWDSEAHLVKELFGRLSRSVQTQHRLASPEYATQMIQLQNEFFRYHNQHPQNFLDQSIISFLISKNLGTPTELNVLRQENVLSFSSLLGQQVRSVVFGRINQDLFELNPSQKDYYTYYLKELALRQNLAAASDRARYAILYQKGGVYIDIDRLPRISPLFLKRVFAQAGYRKLTELLTHPSLREFLHTIVLEGIKLEGWKLEIASRYCSEMKLQLIGAVLDVFSEKQIIDSTTRQTLKQTKYQGLSGWENRQSYYEELSPQLSTEEIHYFESILREWLEVGPTLMTDTVKEILRTQLNEPEAFEPIMESLGEVHVFQDHFKVRMSTYTPDNSLIASLPKNPDLLDFIASIFDSDEKIVQNKWDRLDSIRVLSDSETESNSEADSNSETDSNFELQEYRYDGLALDSRATVYLSGPIALQTWMENRFYSTFIQAYGLGPEYISINKRRESIFRFLFDLPDKITTVTEESRISTWLHEPFEGLIAPCEGIPGDQKRRKRQTGGCLSKEAEEAFDLLQKSVKQQNLLKDLQLLSRRFEIKKLHTAKALPSLVKANVLTENQMTRARSLGLMLEKLPVFENNLGYLDYLAECQQLEQPLSEKELKAYQSFIEGSKQLSQKVEMLRDSQTTPLVSWDHMSAYFTRSGDISVELSIQDQIFAVILRKGPNYKVYLSGLSTSLEDLNESQFQEFLAFMRQIEGANAVVGVNAFKQQDLKQISQNPAQTALYQDIETEEDRLALQDKQLGLLKLYDAQRGYEVSRVQLHRLGLKIHVDGLHNPSKRLDAEITLTQDSLNDYLADKKLSLEANKYLSILKEWNNHVEWHGSQTEILKATQYITVDPASTLPAASIVRQIKGGLKNSAFLENEFRTYLKYQFETKWSQLTGSTYRPLSLSGRNPMLRWQQTMVTRAGSILLIKNFYDIGLAASRNQKKEVFKGAFTLFLAMNAERIERKLVSVIQRRVEHMSLRTAKNLKWAMRFGVTGVIELIYLPDLITTINTATAAPEGSLQRQDAMVQTFFAGSNVVVGLGMMAFPGVGTLAGLTLLISQMSYQGFVGIRDLEDLRPYLGLSELVRVSLRSSISLSFPEDVEHLIDDIQRLSKRGQQLLDLLQKDTHLAGIVGSMSSAWDGAIPLIKVNLIEQNRFDLATRAVKTFSDTLPNTVVAGCLPEPQPHSRYSEAPFTQKKLFECSNAFVLLRPDNSTHRPKLMLFFMDKTGKGTVSGSQSDKNLFYLDESEGLSVQGGDNTQNIFSIQDGLFEGSIQGGKNASNRLIIEKPKAPKALLFFTQAKLPKYGAEWPAHFKAEKQRFGYAVHQTLAAYTNLNASTIEHPFLGVIWNHLTPFSQATLPASSLGEARLSAVHNHLHDTLSTIEEYSLAYNTTAFNVYGLNHILSKRDAYFFCLNLEEEPWIESNRSDAQSYHCRNVILSSAFKMHGKNSQYRAFVIPAPGVATVHLKNSTLSLRFPETDLLQDADFSFNFLQNCLSIEVKLPLKAQNFQLNIFNYNQTALILRDRWDHLVQLTLPSQNNPLQSQASTKIQQLSVTIPIEEDSLVQAAAAYDEYIHPQSRYQVYARLVTPHHQNFIYGSSGSDRLFPDSLTRSIKGDKGEDTYYFLDQDLCAENRSVSQPIISLDNRAKDGAWDAIYLDRDLTQTPLKCESSSQDSVILSMDAGPLACIKIEFLHYFKEKQARHLMFIDNRGMTWVLPAIRLEGHPLQLIPLIQQNIQPSFPIRVEDIQTYPAYAVQASEHSLVFYRENHVDLRLVSLPMEHIKDSCELLSAIPTMVKLEVQFLDFYKNPKAWNMELYLVPEEILLTPAEWHALAQNATSLEKIAPIYEDYCQPMGFTPERFPAMPAESVQLTPRYCSERMSELDELSDPYAINLPDIVAHFGAVVLGEFQLGKRPLKEIQLMTMSLDAASIKDLRDYVHRYFKLIYRNDAYQARWTAIWQTEDAARSLIGLMAKAYCTGISSDLIKEVFMLESIETSAVNHFFQTLDELDPDSTTVKSVSTMMKIFSPILQANVQTIQFFPEKSLHLNR